ncbi:hypothetical protein C8T65DRAFT_90780 [Cerioporus squamosus]|nr:hypothetical protein C8T65DRAFT_90780 [Cerioporus squamosus]
MSWALWQASLPVRLSLLAKAPSKTERMLSTHITTRRRRRQTSYVPRGVQRILMENRGGRVAIHGAQHSYIPSTSGR